MANPQQIGSIINRSILLGGLRSPQEEGKKEEQEQGKWVHPIMTTKDFKETIALYNHHIKQYNAKVWLENAEIRDYNRQVIRNRRKASISMEQKFQEACWKESHKALSPEQYNKAVEKYNEKHGFQIRKKNIRQEVKPDTEKFFIAFLHQYNMQLYRRANLRRQLEVYVPGSLPKLELYPNLIIEAERDGYKNLPVSVETVRHHRERLEEAGVLLDYSYHGPNRPIKIAFNEQILSITDNKSPKSTPAENQRVTSPQTNKVQYNNVSSRNTIIEDKYREKGVVATAPTRAVSTGSSTGTPKKQAGKKFDGPVKSRKTTEKTGGAPKNEVSELLACQIDPRTELVQALAAGKYSKYKPFPQRLVEKEAFHGALHPDDFKEMAIQDIFRFAASLFDGMNVHPGSWMNAYKVWMKEKFVSFNGHTFNKPGLAEHWQKAIQVLREIKRYKQNHPEWTPTYPNHYFDPARSLRENNSFEFAYRNFRLDEKKVESYQKRRNKALKNFRSKTDVKKAQEQIRRMLAGKISLDTLFSWVRQNTNKEVYENLNNLIKREYNKINNQ